MEGNLLEELDRLETLALNYDQKIRDYDSACTEKVKSITQKWDEVVREKMEKVNALTRYKSGCKQYIDGVHSLYVKKMDDARQSRLDSVWYKFKHLNSEALSYKVKVSDALQELREAERSPLDSSSRLLSGLGAWAGAVRGMYGLTALLGYVAGFGLLGHLGYCIFSVAGDKGVTAIQAGLSAAAFMEVTPSMLRDMLAQFFAPPWVLAAIGSLPVIGIASLVLNKQQQKKKAKLDKQSNIAGKKDYYEYMQRKLREAKASVEDYMEENHAYFTGAYSDDMFDSLDKANGYFKKTMALSQIEIDDKMKKILINEAMNETPKNFDQSVYQPSYTFWYV